MTTPSEQEPLAFLLNSSARFLNSVFERRISSAGLGLTPGEARALLTVAAINGAKQADIAARIGLEPMTVCTYLDKLESLDLLERRPNPDDRRSKCIYLTESSTEMLKSVREEVNGLMAQATEGLGREDIDRFHAILSVMQKNLHAAAMDKSRAET
jgi:DNA-binding MarR family transcriptional regulator